MADDRPAPDRSRRREDAEAILRAAIAAADPAGLVDRALHGAPELAGRQRIRVLAIGKAAPRMARSAGDVLGTRIASSMVVAPAGSGAGTDVLHGAHPLPDESSVAAGRAVLHALAGCTPDDMLLVLLSGGASAVAALPLEPLDIHDYADCTARLLRRGAGIGELNAVRKHIDALKGGRMALAAQGATTLCLVLSDVIGDAVDVVGSGPFSPDPTTCEDALDVLRRYDLLDGCAASIRHLLETRSAETPKHGDPAFERVRVRVIGGNDVAVSGAASRAAELGYHVRRAPLPVTGFAHVAGATLAAHALLLQREEHGPICIIGGGETTVNVRGDGRGGRNQELVLAACVELDGAPGITVGSIGTDGVDGPTDAAGAIADEETLSAAALAGLDAAAALADNDSHTFFARTGGLVITGPTGTNVNDVQIALIMADGGTVGAAPPPPA